MTENTAVGPSAPAVPAGSPLYVINGFYMAMRDAYTKAGARIQVFDVEWDAEKLSWEAFRKDVLGATDPEASTAGSLRGTIKEKWQELGLAEKPSVQNNGVHASASPFEALAERVNWLGVDIEQDPVSKALASAGVSVATQKEWCQDPQVPFEGKQASLFDTLEDMDLWPLLARAASVVGAAAPGDGSKASCPKNRAVVFVKPHACVEGDPVAKLVREKFASVGIQILSEASIGNKEIDEKKLIDKHYGAIAAKASLLTPDQTNPSDKAKESFKSTFGLAWEDALKQGVVKNAVDACKHMQIDGMSMSKLWDGAKADKKLIKFGGGFYCGQLC
jgi:uncharacterized protein YfiM (DUF2279 family)